MNAILHWYLGALKHLHAALDAGMRFSVNMAMLASRRGQRIVAALPRERALTETDGPHTRHGDRPCEPRDVPVLVGALAKLWNDEPDAMVSQAATRRVEANRAVAVREAGPLQISIAQRLVSATSIHLLGRDSAHPERSSLRPVPPVAHFQLRSATFSLQILKFGPSGFAP